MKPVLGGKAHILPLWLFSPMVVAIKVETKWFLLEEEGTDPGGATSSSYSALDWQRVKNRSPIQTGRVMASMAEACEINTGVICGATLGT